MEYSQGSISRRQKELRDLATKLARSARKNHWAASAGKAVLIVLGATSATRAVADQLIGTPNPSVTITYTLVGLLTATVAGLAAAFKYEERAAKLNVLATETWVTIREVDSRWQEEIGSAPPEDRQSAALKLIHLQDSRLADIQSRAAEMGINIPLDVGELHEAYAA